MYDVSLPGSASQALPEELYTLFAQLDPEDVELFYQGYQLWNIERDIAALQAQIKELQQPIESNAERMDSIQPSPIALSALAQLQAYGVSDLDLLDSMLERGESWLDHTMQLLARCEQLDVIRGDYTQWCENALEGAYNWLDSMDEAAQHADTDEPFDENVEAALLLKLMSEEATEFKQANDTVDIPDDIDQHEQPSADQPLAASSLSADQVEIAQPAAVDTTQADRDHQPEAIGEESPVATTLDEHDPATSDQAAEPVSLDDSLEEVASIETPEEATVPGEEMIPADTEQDQQTESAEQEIVSPTATIDPAKDKAEKRLEEDSDQPEHTAENTTLTTQSQEDEQVNTYQPQQDKQADQEPLEPQQSSAPIQSPPPPLKKSRNLLARLIHKRRQR